MSEEDLRVRIRLIDARLAQVEAERTGKAIRGIGTSSKTAGAESEVAAKKFDLMGRATRAFKWGLAVTGIGGLVFGIKDAISAGQEWQQQQAQLRNALKNTGQAVGPAMKMLNEEIDKSATHGGFALQDEAQGIAQFVRLTGSATEAAKLNASAINLARGANIGYGQAVRMLSQIQTGNTGRLQRFIGILKPVTTNVDALRATTKHASPELLKHAQILDKQATAAEANRRIMAKYGGSSAAYSHTAAGAMSNAKHSFELLAEELGKQLLPSIAEGARALTALAPKIGNVFRTAIRWIKETVRYFKEHKTLTEFLITLTATLLAGYLAFRVVIGVIRAVTAAQAALNIVMDANPIGLVVVAVAALVAGFITLYHRNERFRLAVQRTFKWLSNAVRNTVAFIKTHWQLLGAILLGPFALAAYAVVHNFRRIKSIATDVANWIAAKFTWLADKITWPFRELIQKGKDAVNWGKNAIHNITHPFGIHFATGGLVPGAGSGGAGDTRMAAVSPGEYVLRRQVVSAVGAQNLQRLNEGGELPDGQSGQQWMPGVTKVFIGPRQVAEAMTQYQLGRQARRS